MPWHESVSPREQKGDIRLQESRIPEALNVIADRWDRQSNTD